MTDETKPSNEAEQAVSASRISFGIAIGMESNTMNLGQATLH